MNNKSLEITTIKDINKKYFMGKSSRTATDINKMIESLPACRHPLEIVKGINKVERRDRVER